MAASPPKSEKIENSAITETLQALLASIPQSEELRSADPTTKAKALGQRAAMKAAAISGGLALPPGPMGMLTIIPDLYAIWKVQRQLVADIAAVYGKSGDLDKRLMVICLFKHGGAALFRDIVVRVGERYLVKRVALRFMQQLLQKIGVRVTQRVIGRGISRWIPVIGAAGVAGYAYYDTTQVAKTAIELFSSELEIEPE